MGKSLRSESRSEVCSYKSISEGNDERKVGESLGVSDNNARADMDVVMIVMGTYEVAVAVAEVAVRSSAQF